MKPCILLLFLALLLTSCNNATKVVPVIDIDHPEGTIDIKLSDILDDITIVPLETRQDILLSSSSRIVVSENYILALVQNRELHQFDKSGKYIRKLAEQGNGPREFNSILYLLIDENRNVAYYTDIKDQMLIFRIDLHTGAFLTPLNTGLSSFSISSVDQDGNIFGYLSSITISIGESNESAKDSLALVFVYDPNKESVKTVGGAHSFTSTFWGQSMVSYRNKAFFINTGYSDTLFTFDGLSLVPQSVLRYTDRLTDIMSGGNYLSFSISYSGGLIISKCRTEMKRDGSTFFVSSHTINDVHVNAANQSKLIRMVTIDPLALQLNTIDLYKEYEETNDIQIHPLPKVDGQWGSIIVEACNMVELINNALAGNALSVTQRRALEELSTQIDEDSNPVLIIGRVK